MRLRVRYNIYGSLLSWVGVGYRRLCIWLLTGCVRHTSCCVQSTFLHSAPTRGRFSEPTLGDHRHSTWRYQRRILGIRWYDLVSNGDGVSRHVSRFETSRDTYVHVSVSAQSRRIRVLSWLESRSSMSRLEGAKVLYTDQYDVVTTTIRLRFDGCSTGVRRFMKGAVTRYPHSHWPL